MNGMRRDKLKRKVCGRLVRDGNAAVGRLSVGAGIMEGENYCGNLLWQSCRTVYPSGGMRNRTRCLARLR